MLKVRFQPSQRILAGEEGQTLLALALEEGLHLPHDCGGEGTCATCAVTIEGDAASLSACEEIEAETLHRLLPQAPASIRLACQAFVCADGEITVNRWRPVDASVQNQP